MIRSKVVKILTSNADRVTNKMLLKISVKFRQLISNIFFRSKERKYVYESRKMPE